MKISLNNAKAKKMFKDTYGDVKNLMADRIEGYARIGGYSVEFASGRKILSPEVFYGITVLKDVGVDLHEHSKTFDSLDEAIDYCQKNLGK
jgi:hypothetical protein